MPAEARPAHYPAWSLASGAEPCMPFRLTATDLGWRMRENRERVLQSGDINA